MCIILIPQPVTGGNRRAVLVLFRPLSDQSGNKSIAFSSKAMFSDKG
jgi:hypothetical protein